MTNIVARLQMHRHAEIGGRLMGEAAAEIQRLTAAITFEALRDANVERQKEWDTHGSLTLEFYGVELAGEAGEACNVIKKLARERLGIRGSRATIAELANELADVVICADLVAQKAGIDLATAVAQKFNATSHKYNLSVFMEG